MSARGRPFLLTVDVESEWEQGTATGVREHLPRLIALFEERGIRATLFCTGEVVRSCREVLAPIPARHELACHADTHVPFSRLPPDAVRDEIRRGKAEVESLGRGCAGFRAPYFYMTPAILRMVASAGFRYDSSWASFAPHAGYMNLLRSKRPVVLADPPIVEIPVPDATPVRIPWGLSWFRVFHPLSRAFLLRTPHLLYLHCDEFLERGPDAAFGRAARWAMNRNRGRKAWDLLVRLLDVLAARGARFVTCSEYVAGLPAAGRPAPRR
ncbi:MAG: polysaccharide deacetylase family protein [Deltaproteobacteria bacterium]|nr:polysaccharide deacetylase family protein [Deltaproteobacteria bacterium]